jgi:hypothetical protein
MIKNPKRGPMTPTMNDPTKEMKKAQRGFA